MKTARGEEYSVVHFLAELLQSIHLHHHLEPDLGQIGPGKGLPQLAKVQGGNIPTLIPVATRPQPPALAFTP